MLFLFIQIRCFQVFSQSGIPCIMVSIFPHILSTELLTRKKRNTSQGTEHNMRPERSVISKAATDFASCLLTEWEQDTATTLAFAQCGDMLTALQFQRSVQHALKCFDGFRNIKAVQ